MFRRRLPCHTSTHESRSDAGRAARGARGTSWTCRVRADHGRASRGPCQPRSTARGTNASLVASVFVNPTQFGPNEDFTKYPRDEAADLAMLESSASTSSFLPTVEEMYPPGATHQRRRRPARRACSRAPMRPGHFRGVATVVTILFDLVQPEPRVLRPEGRPAVGRDQALHPRPRPAGGDRRLSDRPRVGRPRPVLAQPLPHARRARPGARPPPRAAAGRGRRWRKAKPIGRSTPAAHGRRARRTRRLAFADYVSIADADTLEELETIDRPALASLAVRFPSARLIDCLPIEPGRRSSGPVSQQEQTQLT